MLSLAVAPLLLGTMATTVSADGINMLDDLKFNGEIRPRFETADVVDNSVDAGTAFTTRTSLGIRSNTTFGQEWLGAYLQGTSVNNFGYTDYGVSPKDPNPSYDLILDPQQARITQAYLDFKMKKTLVRAGRQEVNLDDQRFVGSVGWRQMFQTLDAVAVVDNSWKPLTLTAAYVYGIIGVGDQKTATDTGSVVINAAYKPAAWLHVTPFAYLLASIHDTYGIRVDGKIALNKSAAITYDASYASQSKASLEYINKPATIDASYYNVNVGASLSGFFVGIDYESLGKANGDSVDGFSTPLATLHKFNGWADVFLGRTKGSGKNKNGLIDLNGRIGYKAKGFGKLMAVYHNFSAEAGDKTDLGTEIDALYANKVPGVNGLSGLLKGAFYTKGETGIGADADKQVIWVGLDYKFAL